LADPVVLSGSSIATFLRCGQQWYYAYVEGIKSPPTIRQAIGIAAHRAIEVDMAQKVDSYTDLPLDDVLDAFSDSYDLEIVGAEEDETENPEIGKDSGLALVKKAHDEVLPKIQPVFVEEPVQFRIDGIPYSGVIDLVDDHDRVRDWKTTKRRPSGAGGLYITQMTGYALAYRQKTGKVESEVVLDHLIRTKLPQYLPIASGGPIDNGAIVTFARIVSDVYAQIQEGRFLPNGLMSQACSWCGYTSICPAYREWSGT